MIAKQDEIDAPVGLCFMYVPSRRTLFTVIETPPSDDEMEIRENMVAEKGRFCAATGVPSKGVCRLLCYVAPSDSKSGYMVSVYCVLDIDLPSNLAVRESDISMERWLRLNNYQLPLSHSKYES